MVPLMKKKTMLIQNLDNQRAFADEQFAINQELLAKNEDLEDRLAAIEEEMRLTKEQQEAIAAAAGEDDIDVKASSAKDVKETPIN